MPITSTEFNFHQLTTVNSELAYLKFILKLSQSRHKHTPLKQPGLIEKIHKPYLRLDYSIHRRLAAISKHYLLLK